MTAKPAWLNISEAVLTPLLLATEERLLKRPASSTHLQMLPSVAVHHLGACAQTGMWANANGNHSVAISLMRHSVEALTVIDIALQDPAYADPLLKDWEDDKKSLGQLRAVLERDIWSRYGVGLWDEPWAEYFGKLARAVQPYAHFTKDLMGWLWSIQDFDGDKKFVIKTGWHLFDPLKASRISLFQALITWTLGRLLLANNPPGCIRPALLRIPELGKSIGSSKLLFRDKNWDDELMPHIFFMPGQTWSDVE